MAPKWPSLFVVGRLCGKLFVAKPLTTFFIMQVHTSGTWQCFSPANLTGVKIDAQESKSQVMPPPDTGRMVMKLGAQSWSKNGDAMTLTFGTRCTQTVRLHATSANLGVDCLNVIPTNVGLVEALGSQKIRWAWL
jgi:hypothetical protein